MLSKKRSMSIVLGLLCMATATAQATVQTTVPDFMVQVPYQGDGKSPSYKEDYYLYVNAPWLKSAKIAPDKGFNSGFLAADDRVQLQLKELTKTAIAKQAAGKANLDEANIANMYECISDKAGRNKIGLGDLAPILKRIDGIQSLQDYTETMADLSKQNLMPSVLLGGFEITPDPVENDRYVLALNSTDTGLSREMFENEQNKEVFDAYQNYIGTLLHLSGRSKDVATKEANDIFNFQKDLALHSLTATELHKPHTDKERFTFDQIQKLYSNVDATTMLNAAGIGPKDGINSWFVVDSGIRKRLNELYVPQNLKLFKEYAVFHLLDDYAPLLTTDYVKANNDYALVKAGAKKAPSGEKLNLETNQGLLNKVYGRQYGKTYFDEARKNQVKSYLTTIMDYYRTKLNNIDWMTPATKANALKKLDNMDINIGYPEAWEDYLDLIHIKNPKDGGYLINNVLGTLKSVGAWERKLVGQPIRKDTWTEMMPQDVNAFYNPGSNSINFPAGILQPPFFDAKASRETNMGGIGMVMGHEITHCFDNLGAQYDEMGRLRNWWQPSDYEEFTKRQANVVKFYNRYTLPDGSRENGELTLSENIADLGSLSCISDIVGHDPAKLRDMYKNFANVWRLKTSHNFLQYLLTNEHALSYVRVDGTLSSTNGFYEAYDVKPGDKMYVAPENRVKLW